MMWFLSFSRFTLSNQFRSATMEDATAIALLLLAAMGLFAIYPEVFVSH